MTPTLAPFFAYYGGKYRIAPKYPTPLQDRIIEPFAGSAGFSLRYPDKQINLYDIDPKICGVWDYLINVSEREVASLPEIPSDKTVDDFGLPQEAKWLIGFSLGASPTQPRKRPSKWARSGINPTQSNASFWGKKRRNRIVSQLQYIRHWTIENKSYAEIDNCDAYWFVDPPYNNKAGSCYKHSDIDFSHLADWCKSRQGAVVVCENVGADWLPFEHFIDAQARPSKSGVPRISKEAIWTNF